MHDASFHVVDRSILEGSGTTSFVFDLEAWDEAGRRLRLRAEDGQNRKNRLLKRGDAGYQTEDRVYTWHIEVFQLFNNCILSSCCNGEIKMVQRLAKNWSNLKINSRKGLAAHR
jgi:hypothetical protein